MFPCWLFVYPHSISMHTWSSPLHDPLYNHCNLGPNSYQLILNPHEYYRLRYHKPYWNWSDSNQLATLTLREHRGAVRARQQDGATGRPSRCCVGIFLDKKWKERRRYRYLMVLRFFFGSAVRLLFIVINVEIIAKLGKKTISQWLYEYDQRL